MLSNEDALLAERGKVGPAASLAVLCRSERDSERFPWRESAGQSEGGRFCAEAACGQLRVRIALQTKEVSQQLRDNSSSRLLCSASSPDPTEQLE